MMHHFIGESDDAATRIGSIIGSLIAFGTYALIAYALFSRMS
jgi:hypothetical protein